MFAYDQNGTTLSDLSKSISVWISLIHEHGVRVCINYIYNIYTFNIYIIYNLLHLGLLWFSFSNVS